MKKELEIIIKLIDKEKCKKEIFCFNVCIGHTISKDLEERIRSAYPELASHLATLSGEKLKQKLFHLKKKMWKKEKERLGEWGSNPESCKKIYDWIQKRKNLKEEIFNFIKAKANLDQLEPGFRLERECKKIKVIRANTTGEDTKNPCDLDKCECIVCKKLIFCKHDPQNSYKVPCHFQKTKHHQDIYIEVELSEEGIKPKFYKERPAEEKNKWQKIKSQWEQIQAENWPSMRSTVQGGGSYGDEEGEWEAKYYKYKTKYFDLKSKQN